MPEEPKPAPPLVDDLNRCKACGAEIPNPMIDNAQRLFGKRPRLPKGWRWLRPGEMAMFGDKLCDVRARPVQIKVGFYLSESHHPVRRKVFDARTE